MEETLFGIEIQKDKDKYYGKIYSNIGIIKEFKNHKIGLLLKDITKDMVINTVVKNSKKSKNKKN